MHAVDLRIFLEAWPFDEERNVRFGRGADGREIILVRKPMGLEQYEVDDRPDGCRVHGERTALDFHRARLEAATQSPGGAIFELSSEDCAEIFEEADTFHQRLAVLFRLRDWPRVERDATQILCLLEFARQHARCAEDRTQIEPWRPHLLRIQLVARAMRLLANGWHTEALHTVRDTLGILGALPDRAMDHKALAAALLQNARTALTTRPASYNHEAESSFIRHDDFWTIRYQGHTAFLKCTRGLQ